MSARLTTPATRRTFLKNLALATGGVVLLPLATGCPSGGKTGKTGAKTGKTGAGTEQDAAALPTTRLQIIKRREYK
jgi:hypothetical protein